MSVAVSAPVYPAGKTSVAPGETAVLTATTTVDHDVTVTVSDGVGSGSSVVKVRAPLVASAPAGSNVTITQPTPGTFNVVPS